MSADNAEAILESLLAIARSVVGESNAVRNTLDLPDDARPAIVILDGDDTTDEMNFRNSRPANAPLVMGLVPEIYLLTSNSSDKIGADLRTLRNRFVKAILADSTLLALCHNREVRYEGLATALANGRGMNGQARLFVRLMHVFRPGAL